MSEQNETLTAGIQTLMAQLRTVAQALEEGGFDPVYYPRVAALLREAAHEMSGDLA